MNEKLKAMKILWASQHKARPRRIAATPSDSLLTVSVLCTTQRRGSDCLRLKVSLHPRLVEQIGVTKNTPLDIGIDPESRLLYLRFDENGNKPTFQTRRNGVPGRASVGVALRDAWGIPRNKFPLTVCSEIEASQGALAAILPDSLFEQNKTGTSGKSDAGL